MNKPYSLSLFIQNVHTLSVFHPVQQAKRWNKNIYVTPSSGGTKKKEEERMNIFCRECAHESLISIHKYIYKTTHLCLMSFAFIVFLLCRVYPKYSKIYLICCILFCWYFRCASCCAPLLVSLSLSWLHLSRYMAANQSIRVCTNMKRQ